MILGNKTRLFPTKEQEQKMRQSVGTARFIYNWTLSRQEENYKNGGICSGICNSYYYRFGVYYNN